MKVDMSKYRVNKFGYVPSEDEYTLVFMPVDGIWVELGHDIPKYRNITLADYLTEINLVIPDYCQYARVLRENDYIIYRAWDCMRVTIYYCKKNG